MQSLGTRTNQKIWQPEMKKHVPVLTSTSTCISTEVKTGFYAKVRLISGRASHRYFHP